MSLIRFSVIKDELYAPDAPGNLVPRAFTSARGRGALGPAPERQLYRPSDPVHRYIDQQLATAAADLPPDKPVVVLIHGFLFDVEKVIRPTPPENDNPHGRVFHFQDRPVPEEIREHTTGWPLHLGFAPDDGGREGLAIAFGWYSNPGLAKSLFQGYKSHYSRAYGDAGKTAWVLVALLRALVDHPALAGRKIDLFCHSLGSRVVVRALAMMGEPEPVLPPAMELLGHLGRVVLLGGSEYVVEAQLMMNRLQGAAVGPARLPDFYNIVSRENDVLDTLGENFGPRTFGDSRVIGHKGLASGRAVNWLDLAIDSGPLRAWMLGRGHDISGDQPGNVWDHWYYYTHRGNMRFYRDVLRDRAAWDIGALRAAGIPDGVP